MGTGEGAAAGSAAGEGSATDKKGLRRVIGGSAIGNGIEWYDYALYGFLTTSIQANFLPGELSESDFGTVVTFMIFAVPFFFRPLGGVIFGGIGDRLGRQRILALTVLLISGGTFLIGLLPSFSVIGWAAPTLLVLLRVIQGLAAGGEYGGAATFMSEHAPDKKRGFYGSFLEFGTLSGYLVGSSLGALLKFTMPEETFTEFGWRIPFLLAAPIGLFGLYMRARLEETPVFKELAEQGQQEHETKTQLKDIVRNWRPVVVCACMVIMVNVINYTLLIYMVEYLSDPERGGLSGGWELGLTAIMYAVMMILMPLGGAASDRFGRKPSWYLSAISIFVLAVPAFYLILHGGIAVKLMALVVLGILYVPQLSTISATFPAMFPTHIRFAGFALTYNVATAISGGPAPAINEALTGPLTAYFPAFFMMAACVIGGVAVYFSRETAGASLRGTDIPDVKKEKTPA